MRLIRALFLLLLSLGSNAEPRIIIERHTPPPFGLGTGSVIEHRIEIFVHFPFRMDRAQLPEPGPVNDWLEIRSLKIDSEETDQGTHYLLDIEFQIFPSLKRSSQLEIPPLPLYFVSSTDKTLLQQKIPPWRFTAATLIPEHASQDVSHIRPLWQPVPYPIASHWRNLAFIAFSLLAVLVILAWRWKWFPWQKSPFARALPRVRLAIAQDQPDQAYRSFHQALNETAGHAVFRENLPHFLHQHPQFEPLRDELSWFFEDSRRLFFSGRPYPPTLSKLERLCKTCIRLEKKCRR